MIDSACGSTPTQYRIRSVASRLAMIAGAVGLLSGCGTLASQSIVAARTPVNEAVATTARQQTLMNIVRVYHNEAPLILDVVEADEMVGVSGQAMGGAAGIGAIASGTSAGRTESAMGIVSAGDAVTNRYIPLQGQALISQLSSQITVETLNALYDSDWPIQSLIDLGIVRLTPYLQDFSIAEDLLTELDADRAISLASAKSGFSKENSASKRLPQGMSQITISAQTPSAGGGDTLNTYYKRPTSQNEVEMSETEAAWAKLSMLYTSTQPTRTGKAIGSVGAKSFIELRNSPITNLEGISNTQFHGEYLGPVMRTYTAIGILKHITSQPRVAFLSEDQYRKVTTLDWNSPEYFRQCPETDTYILNPDDPDQNQFRDSNLFGAPIRVDKAVTDRIGSYLRDISSRIGTEKDDHIRNYCIYSYATSKYAKRYTASIHDLAEFAKGLNELKRFIIVVKSNQPIEDAFASWFDKGVFYSIMPNDVISQRNLMLIAQFLTIQAISTPSPSLTTISPSGR